MDAPEASQPTPSPRLLIMLKAARGYHVVDVRMILSIEADTRYAVLRLLDGRGLAVFHTLSVLEEWLQCGERYGDLLFLRIHRSHIVAFHHTDRIEGKHIVSHSGTHFPVSRQYWPTIRKVAVSIRTNGVAVHDT
jgi:DNA-binding LytR/AlgR family response regulator